LQIREGSVSDLAPRQPRRTRRAKKIGVVAGEQRSQSTQERLDIFGRKFSVTVGAQDPCRLGIQASAVTDWLGVSIQ